MRVLITGGPTREYLDDVRCLTNPSSGRMGMELARAARARKHAVTLVTGPTAFPDPAGVRVVRVTSAREMAAAVAKAYPRCDVLIASAAVSDYRPRLRKAGKVKKGPARATLELVANPDILAACGRKKGRRVLVGFALESRDGLKNARKKLLAKNLDLVVLNDPGSFAAERIGATFVFAEGAERLPKMTKEKLAGVIFELLDRPHGGECACGC